MQKKRYVNFSHHLLDTASAFEIVVYGTLASLYRFSDAEEALISPGQIYYSLFGNTSMSRRYKDKICEALMSLDVIVQRGSSFILDISKLMAEPPYEECDMKAFIALRDKPELFLHYINIIRGRMFNYEICGKVNIICRYPIEHFAELENVSPDTIMRYNAALEDMQLIYVARHKFNGESRETNIYSLYDDRELVDKYIGSFSRSDSSQANKDRSLSMRYSKCLKAPEKYSKEYIRKLIEDVEEYNARMQELGKKQPDFLLRVKDIDRLTKLINCGIIEVCGGDLN